MTPAPDSKTTSGFLATLGAFASWGLLPIYWKLLDTVPPFEILCHRIVWSLVFVSIILWLKKGWSGVKTPLRTRLGLPLLCISSLLIGLNWMLYIWAVVNGHIVETSLGYYINPLVSILLGYVFLKERMTRLQLAALCIASAGVANSIFSYGHFPWIALTLAISFAFYGLVRKIAPAESLPGLFLETAILSPLALGYVLYVTISGQSAFLNGAPTTDLLLFGAGAATSLPLLGFAFGARRLRLITVGLLQYLAPSIAFLLGVFVYGEPFTQGHLVTFCCIWTALAIYTADGLLKMRSHSRHLKGAKA